MRLFVHSWRWSGVPFYIRAGKCLPVTCTEVIVRLNRPPPVFPMCTTVPNYMRFRISPDVEGAFGLTVMDAGDRMVGQQTELLVHRAVQAGEMEAYEPGTWGPGEVSAVTPRDGWADPAVGV